MATWALPQRRGGGYRIGAEFNRAQMLLADAQHGVCFGPALFLVLEITDCSSRCPRSTGKFKSPLPGTPNSGATEQIRPPSNLVQERSPWFARL